MFDILVYLFENYYQTDLYPDQDALARKLTAAGFEHEDISDALAWLQGLSASEESTLPDSLAESTAFRGYAEVEASKLGVEGRGFLAFLEGASVKKVEPKVAERVFDLMEKFAGYGFNRSHSAAYGMLTYQTAYLKRYFPTEFYAALLTCDKDDTDAVVKFIAEARSAGIAVLRPDVNESGKDFSVVETVGEPDKAGKAAKNSLK